MTKMRIAGLIGFLIIVLLAAAYHVLVGYVAQNKIANGITVLTRQSLFGQIGANVVVFEDDQMALVVDTQLTQLAGLTRSKIDDTVQSPIAAVVVTHWHPDHSGGISGFSSDIPVIAHENVARRLSSKQEGFGLTKPGSHHEFPARTADSLPSSTFAERLEIPTGSSVAVATHYPSAHTDGDLAVFFHDAKVVAIGDLVWPGSFPYVDSHNGGTVSGLEAALEAILEDTGPDYRFVPGHGEAITHEDLRTYLQIIRQSRMWVEERLDGGQSLEELLTIQAPDEWRAWSSDLVPSMVWIQMIYDSYAREAAVQN